MDDGYVGGPCHGGKRGRGTDTQKKPAVIQYLRVASQSNNQGGTIMGNKDTGSLAHTTYECKYHIVFAMMFSITHRCVSSIKADYCSM